MLKSEQRLSKCLDLWVQHHLVRVFKQEIRVAAVSEAQEVLDDGAACEIRECREGTLKSLRPREPCCGAQETLEGVMVNSQCR